jgi:Mrp family chromosome partitioning ATPase/capsular polysaccharide biosynthesis protein
MDPLHYLRVLRRRWALLLGAAVVGALAAYVLTDPAPSTSPAGAVYDATHTLLDEDAAVVSERGQASELSQFALLATTGEVPVRAAEALDFPGSPAELVTRVRTETDAALGSIAITASDPRPERAEQLADEIARHLLDVLEERATAAHDAALLEAQAHLDELAARVADLDEAIAADPEDELLATQRDIVVGQYGQAFDALEDLRATGALSTGLSSVADAIAIPRTTAGVRAPSDRPTRMLLAAGVGFVLALAGVVLAERLNPRIRSREAAEANFGLPVIAEIPRRTRRHRSAEIAPWSDDHQVAEAYRLLRTPLLLRGAANVLVSSPAGAAPPADAAADADADEPRPHLEPSDDTTTRSNGSHPHGELRTILVVAPDARAGKTTVAANLGVVLAEARRSVLLLDLDLRHPQLHDLFDIPRSPGLADLLAQGAERNGRVLEALARPTAGAGLRVIPSGESPGSAATLMANASAVVGQARALADVVVIDTPPLLYISDASDLIPAVDAVVVVCRVDTTTVRDAVRTSDYLGLAGAPVLGVVLVGTPPVRHLRSTYYGRNPEPVEPQPDRDAGVASQAAGAP